MSQRTSLRTSTLYLHPTSLLDYLLYSKVRQLEKILGVDLYQFLFQSYVAEEQNIILKKKNDDSKVRRCFALPMQQEHYPEYFIYGSTKDNISRPIQPKTTRKEKYLAPNDDEVPLELETVNQVTTSFVNREIELFVNEGRKSFSYQNEGVAHTTTPCRDRESRDAQDNTSLDIHKAEDLLIKDHILKTFDWSSNLDRQFSVDEIEKILILLNSKREKNIDAHAYQRDETPLLTWNDVSIPKTPPHQEIVSSEKERVDCSNKEASRRLRNIFSHLKEDYKRLPNKKNCSNRKSKVQRLKLPPVLSETSGLVVQTQSDHDHHVVGRYPRRKRSDLLSASSEVPIPPPCTSRVSFLEPDIVRSNGESKGSFLRGSQSVPLPPLHNDHSELSRSHSAVANSTASTTHSERDQSLIHKKTDKPLTSKLVSSHHEHRVGNDGKSKVAKTSLAAERLLAHGDDASDCSHIIAPSPNNVRKRNRFNKNRRQTGIESTNNISSTVGKFNSEGILIKRKPYKTHKSKSAGAPIHKVSCKKIKSSDCTHNKKPDEIEAVSAISDSKADAAQSDCSSSTYRIIRSLSSDSHQTISDKQINNSTSSQQSLISAVDEILKSNNETVISRKSSHSQALSKDEERCNGGEVGVVTGVGGNFVADSTNMRSVRASAAPSLLSQTPSGLQVVGYLIIKLFNSYKTLTI